MSAGFTPGPWKPDGLTVSAFGRGTIANIPTPQKGGVTECMANAHLIAAAPALYEALYDLANVLIKAFPSLANTPNLERAHEALKQARGDQ